MGGGIKGEKETKERKLALGKMIHRDRGCMQYYRKEAHGPTCGLQPNFEWSSWFIHTCY